MSRWFTDARYVYARGYIFICWWQQQRSKAMVYVYMKIPFNPPKTQKIIIFVSSQSSVIVMCTTVNDKLSLRENGSEWGEFFFFCFCSADVL